MKTLSEAAARKQAERGSARVHEATLVAEPTLITERLWVIRVRLMMSDGTVRGFECESTKDEVFSV
jgi:hypothetical protein